MAGKGSLVLGIKLDGEKEFKDELAKINAGIRVNAAEMQKITATYADNNRSVQALTAQDKALGDQITSQSDKVELLAAALKESIEKYGEGSKKALEWKASLAKAEAQLIELENEQKRNNKALDEAKSKLDENGNALDDVQEKTGSYGSAASKIFKALGLDIGGMGDEAVSAFQDVIQSVKDTNAETSAASSQISSSISGAPVLAAAGLAAAIIKIGKEAREAQNEIESATSRMQASLRLTREEAEKVTESMRDIYKKGIASDQDEAQAALTSVMKLMGLQGEAAEDAANKIIAMEVDSQEAARTAGTMMQQFGISAEEALDIIAYGLTTSADKNGDLLDVLNEYSNSYQRMGYSAEEFLTMIVSATDAGAYSADKAADSFKEFYNKAASGDTAMAEALTELHFSSDGVMKSLTSGGEIAQSAYERVVTRLAAVTDESKQATLASAMFGFQWEDVGTQAILAMADTEKQIIQTSGEAQRQFDIMANSAATVDKQFDRGLEDVWNVIKTSVANAAIPGKGLYESIKGLTGEIKQMGASGGQETGTAISSGIAEGIKQNQQIMDAAMKDSVNSIVSAAKEAAEIHSPSKLFEREVGKQMAAGVGTGWNGEMKAVQSSIQSSITTAASLAPQTKTTKIYNSDNKSAITQTINVTIDAKNVREFNDMVRIAENARQSRRMGYVKG